MLSLQDAKNGFSAVVAAALDGRPQHVSRRGRPAVVVISEAEYARKAGYPEHADRGYKGLLSNICSTGRKDPKRRGRK